MTLITINGVVWCGGFAIDYTRLRYGILPLAHCLFVHDLLCSGSNEKVYYPNSVLASKPISNFYRSPDQWDSIDFQIHATTPVEKIGLLKEKMTKYIEGLPQYWYPTFRLVCKDIEDSNRMKMALWMQHHMNYQVNFLHINSMF